MAATASIHPHPSTRSAAPEPPAKTPNNKYVRPLKRTRPNFIPAQSWLAYNWIDKDPELEFVCGCIEDSGMTLEQIERETEAHGHKVSRYTMYGWLYGETKRPHNATMSTVMSAIGWERHWTQRAA